MARYQELNGPHSSGVPAMRNLPLFLFLTGLVIIFYFFYIYQAQGTELSMTRDQLELTSKDLRGVKEELIDAKAAIEKLDAAEKKMKSENDELTKKADDCQTGLRSAKLQADSLNSEKTRLDGDTKDKDAKISTLTGQVAELLRNFSSLEQLSLTQTALVQQLNSTIAMLQAELAEAKAAPRSQAAAQITEAQKAAVSLDRLVVPQNPAETLTNNAGAPQAAQADAQAAAQQQQAQQAGVIDAPQDKQPNNGFDIRERDELKGVEVDDQQ